MQVTEASEVLIVGAGLAGLYAALSFAPRPVTVLSPCRLGDGASSTWAQGGVAAAMDKNDTPAAHAKDADAEFVQFHPTAIDLDCDPVPLATEALRGEGAVLVNRKGERFMTPLHPDAELAPRDIVARAIFTEYRDGNRPALDTRKAIGAHILEDFPTVSSVCKSNGIDPVTEVIPVIPAAHYHMGGVACDASGLSSIPGLWVAGEAASTGLHGANRLASNGLLEALVFAVICSESIAQQLTAGLSLHTTTVTPQDAGVAPDPKDLQTLRQTMSNNVSVLRDENGLSEALRTIRRLDRKHKNKSVDFANMLAAATVITAAALQRTESRGGHYRSDFPAPDANQAQRSFLTLSEALVLRDAQ